MCKDRVKDFCGKCQEFSKIDPRWTHFQAVFYVMLGYTLTEHLPTDGRDRQAAGTVSDTMPCTVCN